jgi:uncharacterized protein (TIGR02145 family)
MQENLKVTHYRNGILIPNVTYTAGWMSMTKGARCYYSNDSTTYAETYGALYNWYTVVDSGNLCPTGWHVPSDYEWSVLTNFLGGDSIAGGKLKDTILWNYPNVGATNSSNFFLLPAGDRGINGTDQDLGISSYLWTSSDYDYNHAWRRTFQYDSASVNRYPNYKKSGFSVRCIRDSTSGIENKTDIINLKIYPNPFSISTTLQPTKPLQNATLTMYDILGNEVKHLQNLNGSEIKIIRESLKSGMYFFNLIDSKGLVGKGKLIVE